MRQVTPGLRRLGGVVISAAIAVSSAMIITAAPAVADPSANAWKQLRQCESSSRYATDTGNGYYGAYQFDLPTWRSVGGTGLPSNASPAEQDYRALTLYRKRGWQPWECASIVGLHEDSDAASGVMPRKPAGFGGAYAPVQRGATSAGGPGAHQAAHSGTNAAASAPAWPGRQYFRGENSATLKRWQKQAGKLGYGLVGTGYFGPHTEHAVREIQRKAGLNVVGFIGPKTWAAAWDPTNAAH
jgi:hypothetical protein